MPVVQASTAYSETMRPGLEGQIATEWGGNLKRETRVVETSTGIGFGRVVAPGTGVKGAVLGATGIVDILGVSIRDVTLVAKEGETVDLYQAGNNMAVMNEGDMWVVVHDTVTANDTATYLAADGTFAPATGIAIPGSRWLTSATSGGVACVRLTRSYHNT